MVEESPSKKSFQIHQRLHQRQRIESFHFVKDDFVANSGLAHSDNRCPPQVDGCLRLRHPELPPVPVKVHEISLNNICVKQGRARALVKQDSD